MKPSVTKLIELLDKPALVKWANKIGLEGIRIDDYRSKYKDSGSSKHEHVEQYLKYKILPEDEGFKNQIIKFFSDKEVISIEESFECEKYVGRFDIKLRWKGFVFICDFKSNSSVYFETKLQLAAYKKACSCDHVAVIHLDGFILRPVDIYNEHYRIIDSLADIFEYKSRLENQK